MNRYLLQGQKPYFSAFQSTSRVILIQVLIDFDQVKHSKQNDEVQVHLTLFTILFIFFNLEFSLCNLRNFFTFEVAAIKVAEYDFQDFFNNFSKSQTCATFSM